MTAILPRHHLVWLDRDGWRDSSAGLDRKTHQIVAEWIDCNLPAVARRRAEGEPKDAIPLGIPLSPAKGRLRIALNVNASAVRSVRPPLALRQVIPSGPTAWQAPLIDLDACFKVASLQLRVYGSLAWQHVTQVNYVTEQSDVDLLLKPRDRGQLEWALTLLQDWERQTGLRADGEVLLPDGAAVAWRELLRARDRVLVKAPESLTLRPVSDLLSALYGKTAA